MAHYIYVYIYGSEVRTLHVTSVTTWPRNRLNHDVDIQKLNRWDIRRCADWDIQRRRNAHAGLFRVALKTPYDVCATLGRV